MKFVCIGYLDTNAFDAAPESVKSELLGQCEAKCIEMRNAGTILVEEGLQHYSLSKCLRPMKGKAVVTDGPFMETKEQIGAVIIIEADSMDEAIRIASLHPSTHLGEEYGWGLQIFPVVEEFCKLFDKPKEGSARH